MIYIYANVFLITLLDLLLILDDFMYDSQSAKLGAPCRSTSSSVSTFLPRSFSYMSKAFLFLSSASRSLSCSSAQDVSRFLGPLLRFLYQSGTTFGNSCATILVVSGGGLGSGGGEGRGGGVTDITRSGVSMSKIKQRF